MNPAKCRSFTVNLSTTENVNFVQLEPVYLYTAITKPNLFEDLYVRLRTSLHFPSNTG